LSSLVTEMAKYRYLKNAPIVEALIDIRAKNPSSFQVKEFSSLRETLKADYPTVDERRSLEWKGTIAGKQIAQTIEDKGLYGYFFKTSDGKSVVQFRGDGFTFSRLAPYTNWDTVLSEARRLWELYSSKALPEVITRIAIRYINKLDLPLPIHDFSDYLTAPPRIPDSLPQEVSQFLTRVVIHESDITANIIQALERSPTPEHVAIILDIDVFKLRETGFNENSVWSELVQLRILKNRIFFESITEEAARLYE